MNRIAAILLCCCFAALSTGAAEWFHNLEHAREDAQRREAEAGAASAGSSHAGCHHHHHADDTHAPAGDDAPVPVHHDENNCDVHARLHMPLMTAGYVPVLVCLGLFVAFLTQLAPTPTSANTPLRIACRGPPAC